MMISSKMAKRALALSSLVCLMAVSISTQAATPDNPNPAIDRSVVAAQILGDWAGFPVPVDAQNNTPWGPIDLAGWVKAASVDQLLAASTATTFDAVVTALRPTTAKAPGAVALGSGQPISANALGSTTSDLVYTPVTPCRVIDTRLTVAGKLGPNSGRNFGISSSNYSAQGGEAASCGIPVGVSAVAINVISTGQTGYGNLKVTETGAAVPTAGFLNFQPGINTANAGISKVALVSSTQGLYIHSTGSASDAVVDIMGYFTQATRETPPKVEGVSGAISFVTYDNFVCQVNFTPTQNWTGKPVGYVSILADSAGTLGWWSSFAVSTNGGATWGYGTSIYFPTSSAPASGWGYSTVSPTDSVSLTAGVTYKFAIRVQRNLGSGAAANSRCALKVELE